MAIIEKLSCDVDDMGTVLVASTNELIDDLSTAKREATVTLFGDSFSAYDNFSDVGNKYQDTTIAASCWKYLIAKLGDRINVTQQAGVGGDTAALMEARLTADVLTPATTWVFGQVGVNDFYGFSYTGAAVFAQVERMIDAIILNGQKVLWLNCYSQISTRGNYSLARTQELDIYNALLANYAKTKDGMILVDVRSASIDWTDASNAGALASWFIGSDKIHLTDYGSFQTGELCLQALAPYMVPGSHTKNMSPIAAGDHGDLNFSNFNGTSGTAGTGQSGDTPNSWTIARQSGTDGTSVGSQNALGHYELAITKSNTSDPSQFRIVSSDLKAGFNDDDVVETTLIMSVDSGLELGEIRVYFYCDNSVDPFYTVEWGRSINGYTYIAMDTGDLMIKIDPSTILDGPLTNVFLYIDIRLDGAGTGIVTLKNIRINDVV